MNYHATAPTMKTTKKIKSGGEAPAETPTTPAPTRPKLRRPRRITLWVVVPCSERRTAEKLAQERTLSGLEDVLAEFVSDLVTAVERPGSWEADRVFVWLDSHYPPPSWIRQERAGWKKEGV
jgi:hypothetical protein